MSDFVYGIVIGVLVVIPSLYLLHCAFRILWATTRDTLTILQCDLEQGSTRLWWLIILPVEWCSNLKMQLWSWWNGIETTSSYRQYK